MISTPEVHVEEIYGPFARLFSWAEEEKFPQEAILEGTAGSGKTHGICVFFKMLCQRYPNARFLFLRSTRRSMSDSVLPIFEKVIGENHPAVLSGGTRDHRSGYKAPGFAEVRLGGMDNKDKLLSTEYDGIWYNEVNEERKKENWESLHRCLRRGHMPFHVMLGDLNPQEPSHMIHKRCDDGVAELLLARIYHNPRAYDWMKREWLPWGEEYLERMAAQTSGVTFRRLFKGERCIAAGAVLDTWDPSVHCITGRLERDGSRLWLYVPDWDKEDQEPWRTEIIRCVGGMDFGYSPHPGVAQVWGMDRWGRIYMLAEVYKRQLHPGQWAQVWGKLYEEFPLLDIILCDHEPGQIELINSHLRIVQDRMGVPDNKRIPSMARKWSKRRGPDMEKAGVGDVRARLARQVDGKRGLYILNGNLYYGKDESLALEAKPWSTVQELPGIVYKEDGSGELTDQIVKKNDHGFDVVRGVCLHLRDRSEPEPEDAPVIPPDSFNARIPGFEEQWIKDGFADPDWRP